MKTLNTFTSEAEYKEARRKYDAYEQASKAYRTEHKTNGIPVEICKTFPYADEVNNELRSKIETYEFINEKPQKYFLYINEKEKIATTWTGDFLGNVHFGREFRNNMGDKRVNIDVYAANGVRYYGTFYKSTGDYARITKKKHQS